MRLCCNNKHFRFICSSLFRKRPCYLLHVAPRGGISFHLLRFFMSPEVIIIGGSYAGLSAALTLGRSLRRVLLIDEGLPCNRQTPHSHNFLTQDHVAPAEIARQAREQVAAYPTVNFLAERVEALEGSDGRFKVKTQTGQQFEAEKLIFATGVRDLLPEIEGLAECWGITAIHCPYCHGYEAKGVPTGILGSSEEIVGYARMIQHWNPSLYVLTNGPASFDPQALLEHGIPLIETALSRLSHTNGALDSVEFADGNSLKLGAIYHSPRFEQHCPLPAALGCKVTDMGHIEVDAMMSTSVPGIYAIGDATTPLRSVSNAVANGTMAGAALNRALIFAQ